MFVSEIKKILTGHYNAKVMKATVDKLEELEAQVAELQEKAGVAVTQAAEKADEALHTADDKLHDFLDGDE